MQLPKNFYGRPVTLVTNLNLTSSTDIHVRLVPPATSGLAAIDVYLDQSAVTNGATGTITWTPAQGTLSVVGSWEIEVADETPGGNVPSSVGSFDVFATLF